MWVCSVQYSSSVSNIIYYSYDGFLWNAATGVSPSNIQNSGHVLSYNGNMWLFGCQPSPESANNPAIYYSYNGINWYGTNAIFGSGGTPAENYEVCLCIIYKGDMWVASGHLTNSSFSTFMWQSYNGIDWFNTTTNFLGNYIITGNINNNINTICWDGKKLIVGGQCTNYSYNNFTYSYDGINYFGNYNYTTTYEIITDITYNAQTKSNIITSQNKLIAGGKPNGSLSLSLFYNYGGNVYNTGTTGINFGTWTGCTGADTSECNAIDYSGNLYVSAGSGTNSLSYSNDGIKWYGLGTNIANKLYNANAVLYKNGLWLVGGTNSTNQSGIILYSYNGLWWLNANIPFSLFTNVLNFGYNNSTKMWIAVGYLTPSTTNPAIGYSYDGINWNKTNNSFSSLSNSTCSSVLVLKNGTWIGGLNCSTSSLTNSFTYSYDGINWNISNYTLGNYFYVYSLAKNGNEDNVIYVAGGITSYSVPAIYYSLNGNTWFLASGAIFSSSNIIVSSIIWTGSYFYAGLVSNTSSTPTIPYPLIYSIDGTNWITLSNTVIASYNINALLYTNTKLSNINIKQPYVLGGNIQGTNYYSNSLAYSEDGISWRGLGCNFMTNCNSIAFNGEIWVAVGNSGFNSAYNAAYSYNGYDWNGLTIINNSIVLQTVLWDNLNNVWNCFSTIGVVYFSYSGIQWFNNGNTISSSINNNFLNVGNNNWLYIGTTGGTGSILSCTGSTYGLSNSTYISPSSHIPNFTAIGANGNAILTATSTGSIYYTNDVQNFTSWVESSSTIPLSPVNSLIYNGQIWVAGGIGSNIGLCYSTGGTGNWIASNGFNSGTGIVGLNLINSSTTGTTYCTWDGIKFIACGYQMNTSPTGFVISSHDGINWNLCSTGKY